MRLLLLVALGLALVFAHDHDHHPHKEHHDDDDDDDHREEEGTEDEQDYGKDDEIVEIKLKTKDLFIIAMVRVHMIEGRVHINGYPVEHGIVNHLHMRLLVAQIHNSVRGEPTIRGVRVRVFAYEKINAYGAKMLHIEQEVVEVEGYEENGVTQLMIHRVTFSADIRLHVNEVAHEESEIKKHDVAEDKHHYLKCGGYRYHGRHYNQNTGSYYGNTHHRHHHKHHRHHRAVYYGTGGVILLLLICLACAFGKRRRTRAAALKVVKISSPPSSAPVTTVPADEKKQIDNDMTDFHFAMDNPVVVVDDKKQLVGE